MPGWPTRIARREVEAAAREEAVRRGASGDVTVATRVVVSAPETRNKVRALLGITVVATAVGRAAVQVRSRPYNATIAARMNPIAYAIPACHGEAHSGRGVWSGMRTPA